MINVFSVGCCCGECLLPSNLCFTISLDPQSSFDFSGSMKHYASAPSYIPTLVNATGGSSSDFASTVATGATNTYPLSFGAGWYSCLTHQFDCGYHKTITLSRSFAPPVTCTWNGTDSYYYFLYCPDAFGFVYLIQIIFRHVTITQSGLGFGGVPFFTSDTYDCILFSGDIVFKVPSTVNTSTACTSFTCSGTDVYILGYCYNPSDYEAQPSCPTMASTGSYSLFNVWTPTYYDYGSLSCTDPTGRMIIEMVDCDDVAHPDCPPIISNGNLGLTGYASYNYTGNAYTFSSSLNSGLISGSSAYDFSIGLKIGGLSSKLPILGGSASISVASSSWTYLASGLPILSGLASYAVTGQVKALGKIVFTGIADCSFDTLGHD